MVVASSAYPLSDVLQLTSVDMILAQVAPIQSDYFDNNCYDDSVNNALLHIACVAACNKLSCASLKPADLRIMILINIIMNLIRFVCPIRCGD
jgi:hypothetical protein